MRASALENQEQAFSPTLTPGGPEEHACNPGLTPGFPDESESPKPDGQAMVSADKPSDFHAQSKERRGATKEINFETNQEMVMKEKMQVNDKT